MDHHTCKICGLELPTEVWLENHKKVHATSKSKIYEYGAPEFNIYRLQDKSSDTTYSIKDFFYFDVRTANGTLEMTIQISKIG
jgi:hypothetical protein